MFFLHPFASPQYAVGRCHDSVREAVRALMKT